MDAGGHFDADGRFVLRDFDARKPFASFLPGIGGEWGVPMWAFYVNRGQGVAAFGVENKDGPLLEFEPANKAYMDAPFRGFRTLLRLTRGGAEATVAQPFFDPPSKHRERTMLIGMNELELVEVDRASGVETRVLYYTVQGEDFPALVRRVTLTNVGDGSVEVAAADGLAKLEPFGVNAGIVRTLCEAIARTCPNALVNIISNPVNSTVPIAAEVFKRRGAYDARKLMGVTHLDVMRARTFVSEAKGFADPTIVDVPVIGGHAGATILPLLSQTTPRCSFTAREAEALTKRIQNGGTEVVEAKGGAGSATLSMAAAAAEFADACLRGLSGESGIWACAYVESSATSAPFFATKVLLGKNGVERVAGVGAMSAYEKQSLKQMLPELKASIQKGYDFARS